MPKDTHSALKQHANPRHLIIELDFCGNPDHDANMVIFKGILLIGLTQKHVDVLLSNFLQGVMPSRSGLKPWLGVDSGPDLLCSTVFHF